MVDRQLPSMRGWLRPSRGRRAAQCASPEFARTDSGRVKRRRARPRSGRGERVSRIRARRGGASRRCVAATSRAARNCGSAIYGYGDVVVVVVVPVVDGGGSVGFTPDLT